MRGWLLCTLCAGQSINIYSEFARIDFSGKVIAPEMPREILSPAVVRNGFTSFQVAIEAPAETKWQLFLGQNPENLFKVTIYKESGEVLEPVTLPYQAQGPALFWMDVWTEGSTPMQRVKIEPELYINKDWVTYPIEARVMEARVPDASQSAMKLVCLLQLSESNSPVAARQLRNAFQDGALAAQAPKDEIAKLLGFCDTPAPSAQQRFWTESYLRIRDYLFRLR